MKWFESKTQREVKELREEIAKLRDELRAQKYKLTERTEIRLGDWPRYFNFGEDPRPMVPLNDVVLMLTERLKLEIKRTPGVAAKTVIERKPKTLNANVTGLAPAQETTK